MSEWTVKKGNTAVQDILIKDADGDTVDNLAAATAISFQIKKNKKDAAALVEKTVALGGILVNTPLNGYLRVTLLPTDTGTTLSVGDYFMGLQITWSPTLIYEVNLTIDNVKTERFRISQDIV